ncbi:hypothetical protein [Streptomyces cavernae]|uniref:hypothetical protein n=1 Tax=Streptomyces cavernae TaxID=2259034 RepID=UPI000FEBFCCA|nr:hypothetical protein [Streptomyces cavernae]
MSPRCQLVVLRGRLWINPSGDAHALQCVARTRKGGRCQNPVESGQVLGLHEFQLGSAGYVQAYGSIGGGEAVDVDRWLAQHCTLHDTPDVTDYETTELRRFDIVRDAAHIRVHRVDVAYDSDPVDCAKESSTTGSEDKITENTGPILEAAARLRPCPGYINGHDYQDWYIEATPDLLLALAQLARDRHRHELADRLERLSKPLCMEPLDPVLSYDALPKSWCGRTVKATGLPCELHIPERAADLGRCTWAGPGAQRICRSAPLEGDDRCTEHAARCRAVKGDGEVCDRPDCRVPKHRQAPASDAAVEPAAAQRCP